MSIAQRQPPHSVDHGSSDIVQVSSDRRTTIAFSPCGTYETHVDDLDHDIVQGIRDNGDRVGESIHVTTIVSDAESEGGPIRRHKHA